MTPRALLPLALWAVLAAPALAAAPSGPDQPADKVDQLHDAIKPDQPGWSILPVPIPWLMVGFQASGSNLQLGPTRSDLTLLAGYFWSNDYVFDPTSTAYQGPGGTVSAKVPSDRWRATAAWDLQLGGGWTLGPYGEVVAGGQSAAGTYDPTLVGGLSARGGPQLRFAGVDDKAFPTAGTTAELLYTYGGHWGEDSFGFHKGGLNAVQYFPLAHNQTVAVRGTVQAGYPRLAWADKFSVGGGTFVRGYAWNRFTGDRLAAAGVEYRNLFVEDAPALVGIKLPLAFGLAGTVQCDAGRAWDEVGVALGNDLRAGGGVGLVLTINRAPLGRAELNGSPEGLVFDTAFGTSF